MTELDTSEIKAMLKNSYANMVPEYGKYRNPEFKPILENDIERFADAVKAASDGVDIVDLGAGIGKESVLLREQGLNVTPIDLSSEMIDECRKKGFENARLMDFYDLEFEDDSFDGAWAAFSLLHVPDKDMHTVLRDIKRVIKPNGIIYASLFEGEEGETIRETDGNMRFFNYMTQEKLEETIGRHFAIADLRRYDLQPRPHFSLLGINIK